MYIVIILISVRKLIVFFFCNFNFVIFTYGFVNFIVVESSKFSFFGFLAYVLAHHYSFIVILHVLTTMDRAKSSNYIIIIIKIRSFFLKFSIGLFPHLIKQFRHIHVRFCTIILTTYLHYGFISIFSLSHLLHYSFIPSFLFA